MVGAARIVGLGEATHGTREIFQAKHRLLEFLVSEMGFNILAIEASLPDTLPLDTYALTGEGDPERLVHGMGFWTWDTEEVLDMMRWVRAWNADPAHVRKVRILGVDMQSRDRLVPMLADRLRPTMPELAAKVTATFGPLKAKWDTDPAVPAAERATMVAAADAIVSEAITKGTDPLTLQLARALAQNLRIQSPNLKDRVERRDDGMAANVAWALEHAGPGSRMALWAHNGHVSRSPVQECVTLGGILRQRFGQDYLPLGFSFDKGSFQALGPGEIGLRPYNVNSAATASMAHALARLGHGAVLLDLRAPATGPVRTWLQDTRPDWDLGAGFDPTSVGYYCPDITLQERFDLLFHIDRTTRARPLPRSIQTADLPIRTVHPSPINLDLRDGAQGWSFHGLGHQFQSGTLTCLDPSEARQGSVYQTVDARPFRGRKVRLTLRVSGEATGLTGADLGARAWLRPDGTSGLLDLQVAGKCLRQQDGVQTITVEAAIPVAARTLSFGFTLHRGGRVRLEGADLAVVR